MKSKIFKKETVANLLAIKRYQDFIYEWLSLYDIYFKTNPGIDAELQSNCLFTLINGLLNKWDILLKENNLDQSDLKNLLKDYLDRCQGADNGE